MAIASAATSRGPGVGTAAIGGLDDAGLARIAKALGHPARLHIVRVLLERQTCIGCDLVDEVGLAQSTVAEHLRILKAAGIITGEIRRPRVCYALNPASLGPLADFLNVALVRGVAASLRARADGTAERDPVACGSALANSR